MVAAVIRRSFANDFEDAGAALALVSRQPIRNDTPAVEALRQDDRVLDSHGAALGYER